MLWSFFGVIHLLNVINKIFDTSSKAGFSIYDTRIDTKGYGMVQSRGVKVKVEGPHNIVPWLGRTFF